MAWTRSGLGAERRRHLGGFDDAEPAAGAGADEDDSPALAQRLRDDLDAVRDAFLLALDRRDDLAILVDDHVDDVGNGGFVDRETGGIDGFGRQRLATSIGASSALMVPYAGGCPVASAPGSRVD